MARWRFAVSAAQSVTTCPSTQDTIRSLVSSFSGLTSPPSALARSATVCRLSFAGPRHAPTATTAIEAMVAMVAMLAMLRCLQCLSFVMPSPPCAGRHMVKNVPQA